MKAAVAAQYAQGGKGEVHLEKKEDGNADREEA